MPRIVAYQIENADDRQRLLPRMVAALGAAYEAPEPTALGILERNDHCYFAEHNDGRTAGVVCCSWSELTVDGEVRKAVRLGMLRADSLASWALCRRLVEDACVWQRQVGKVIVWGRTASPKILVLLAAFFADLNPRLDGGYDEGRVPVARAIRQLHPEAGPEDHPFILRGVAGHRYSPSYQTLPSSFVERHKVEIFDRYRIDEAAGDRIVYCSRLARRKPS
ncbi:MAG TPA: hypothetical protein VMW27_13305 [Thermoanaerobaculia bacterium]|nr:hypothetical protein [Thermoanaerobaculia bacterium]